MTFLPPEHPKRDPSWFKTNQKAFYTGLAIVLVIIIVVLLASCSTADNDVIDQAIAARIYNR